MIIDPKSFLALILSILMSFAQVTLMATFFFVSAGYILIPKHVRHWILAAIALSFLGNTLILTMLLSDHIVNPYVQWSAYLVYMQLLWAVTLIELELLKLFTIAARSLFRSWIFAFEILLSILVTILNVGHYINPYVNSGSEKPFLAAVFLANKVQSLGHPNWRRSELHSESLYKYCDLRVFERVWDTKANDPRKVPKFADCTREPARIKATRLVAFYREKTDHHILGLSSVYAQLISCIQASPLLRPR